MFFLLVTAEIHVGYDDMSPGVLRVQSFSGMVCMFSSADRRGVSSRRHREIGRRRRRRCRGAKKRGGRGRISDGRLANVGVFFLGMAKRSDPYPFTLTNVTRKKLCPTAVSPQSFPMLASHAGLPCAPTISYATHPMHENKHDAGIL